MSISSFLEGNRDYMIFAGVMTIFTLIVILLVRKIWLAEMEIRRTRPVYLVVGAISVLVLFGGWFLVQYAEKREFDRTQGMLSGNAPILAYEMSSSGYGMLGLNTPPDDPDYVRLIGTMINWMKLNPQIISFYTLRKLENGRSVFILGPETDYNRDGRISGELESRVPIGEVYEEWIPELEASFLGQPTFQAKVTEDQWGQTISAFVPIMGSNGRQIDVLGLDFDGSLFLKNVAETRLRMTGVVFFLLLIMYVLFASGAYYVVERQLRRHKEELRHLAYYDALTGLPNRALFRERLQEALTNPFGSAYSAAVLHLDIKRFKNVNDSLGHAVGDRLLVQLAKRLEACLDRDDLLARPGADEFVIFLGKVSSVHEVQQKAENILSAFDQPVNVDEYELFVAPSVGIAVYPDGGTEADSLIRNSDTAMYFAKERGIDLHLYTEDMNDKLLERLSIENDMRRGIERKEFFLVYQPKIDTRSGKTVGAEALIRWNHPTKGMISPAQFIPVAEDTGLIVPLGEWVLSEACRQLKAWEAQGFRPIQVSVNLSSRQFEKKDLISRIRNIISEYRVDPACLQLELTESSVMQTPELSNHTLYQLKKSGLSIALDDFGTGYSSFSYLPHLPLDVLKIDKGFVKDVTVNPDNAAIVTAMIALAHNLGLKVICEGVETKEQLDFLKDRDCDEIQGFYYSRPLPPEEFEKWLVRVINAADTRMA
ncbi:putative bifunctional diguanylate cyclase/phosphodiesterase [Cohnella suwonensis]|uniref:Bifunctional diguanylate cyclase/phosphodiesterase n=1 Tax=Cohnella suwonensis TaxID=696072 RepID=A0ABW0M3R5_9BACL